MRSSAFYRKYTPFSYALLLTFTLVFSGVAGSNSDSNLESYSLPVSGNTIDIDGNGKFDALTDGLLLLRSMFELSGTPLISGVVANDAVYKSSGEIEARIGALGDRIDIDNDGRIDALTDGLLILRYLFELSGDTLTAGVVSDGAQRSNAADIESYLLKLTTFGPMFTSSATFSAAENQTSIGIVTATDADSGDSIIFTVSGSELVMTSVGVLSFASAPDYETKASYTATVTASDGTNTTTQAITVNVTNVNDNLPVFTSSATFSASENQTSIGTVTATDADSGDSITFTVSGSELAITSGGVLSFKTAADYETKPTYTATVTASDGTNTETQTITVNVIDVNENSDPVIVGLSSSVSTDENTKPVTQVNASDADGDTIYYSLSGVDADLFTISSSGLINFKSAPDYETPLDMDGDNTYVIGVSVSDQNLSLSKPNAYSQLGKNTSAESISVLVNNIDEDLIDLVLTTTDGTSASAPTLNISLKIDELTQASEVQVLTWLVGNTQTWHTASKVDALSWSINTTLSNSAASGTYEIRKVLIKRTDLDELTIVDTALKEKGFDIDSEIYNSNADATDPILTGIDSITVSGNDGDSSTNILVTIVASVTDGFGEIEKAFSYIKGAGGETAGNWGTLTSDKSKVIFVFSLDPKVATGTYTIDDIRLYDVAGNQSFYTNSNLESLGFTNSWMINNVIADNAAPNITGLSLDPTINVSDLNRKQIKIDLTVDDQDTAIRDIYVRLISPENANIDQYIVDQSRLFTTTVNENTYSHTISLPLEYPDGTYNISYIFINDQALNNRRYTVSDLNIQGFNTNVVFGSGNDHAPDISSSSSFSVAENQTSIGIVTATDADGDTLSYSISGADAASVSINSSSGALSFNISPDYETRSSYSIIVTVSDGTNETTKSITINVTDVNDAPVFTSDATFRVAENQTAIGTVGATDADSGDSVTFTVSGSELSITSAGVLSFATAPDYETKASYTATVTATDGTSETTQSITINVTNIDEAPVFTSSSTFSAPENQNAIGTVIATDADGDTISYSLTGLDASSLSVNSNTGVLTFNSSPDYETKSTYSVIVTASDGANSPTQSITVNVTDVNDAPMFISSSTFSVPENQTSIGSVIATDADGDTINFSLAGTDASLLSVNSSTGVLTFNSSPDYETKSTYSVTAIAGDGANSAEQSITVNVNDVPENVTGEAFTGKAVDGYISGAIIFIDQNFNFKHDSGEYAGLSDANGAFSIIVESSKVSCLKSRPIVATVPVGALDSTLGTVTQAYQMILPSIDDTGSSSIVISPFTSLFSEAILSAKSNLKEDLTVDEGCSSSGDDVASTISSRIDSLKLSISNSFGISFTDLTSDFIASSGVKVNETAAQNIAKLLPYLQKIDNQVSDGLTSKFGKDIRANVSLSESALAIIFGGSSYEKLPLDFKSVYRTDANAAGWYQEERLEASGAFISDSGVLSRADCSETDTELCSITDLSLKNISNASTSYQQTSDFFNSDIDFNDINVTSGTLYVNASDSRTWRNNSANWRDKNNRDRECQADNQIRFQNSVIAGTKTEFQYSSYSQGYQKADCDLVRHYYFPILKTQTFIDNVAGNSLQMSYYVHDINRSGISENFPYDFITNRINIDPTAMIKEIAALPRTLADLDKIRRMLNGGDYVLYVYHKDSATNAYFEVGTNPRNDMFWDYASGSNDRLYGQSARTAFYNRVSAESAFSSSIYGDSAPVNPGVLGRISNSLIEVIDYSESDQIKIPVYPTYDAASKTLDFSINGASLDLENIHNFIENGIDGTPVSANVWYNPDDSISATVPVKLFLYQGNDTTVDPGEGYFSIEFDLTVTSAEGNDENPNQRTATQTWEIPADSTIIVKYTEDTVTLSKTISNSDVDKIVLSDGRVNDLDDALIGQPSSLNAKILTLIAEVSSDIDGIKGFFTDSGTYTLKVDLAAGGHSLVGYYRNTIDYITGTFTVKSTPTYPISVNDMRIHEGSTEDLCFFRPSKGNLDPTSFNLSFTQRERPGKGALVDDFSLSASTVNFVDGETQKCIQITATEDTHFDWVHDAYIDISSPSSGQALSRSQVKISILDSYGFQNRISFKER
jgi:hypothetical protein